MKVRNLTILISATSLLFLLAFPLVAEAGSASVAPTPGQPTDTVNFNFNSVNTKENITIIMAQDTTWASLTTKVEVGVGGSVAFQLIDPNNKVQGTAVASGAPNSIQVNNPVSGQWSLYLSSQNGQSVPVTVTVTGGVCNSFFCSSNLLIIVLLVVLIVIVTLAVIFAIRRGKGEGVPTIPPPGTMAPSSTTGTQVIQRGTMTYFAALELPGGQTIPMTQMTQDFGRADFEPLVPKEVSAIISRRHFQISLSARDKKFYIEDVGSTNGTMVNSADIRGKGKVPLNSGDTVSPADVINLKFKG